MERAARVIFLLAWTLLLAFFPAWEGAILWTGGLVYLLLTAGTAGRRMAAAKRMLAAG
jgi:hypothetical protein